MSQSLVGARQFAPESKKKSIRNLIVKAWVIALAMSAAYSCTTLESSNSSEGPSPELSPEEEMATFRTDPGLKVELVASEPLVQDPVVSTFDEDGRLWVVEMRAYMPNMEGEGERQAIGRVSVLEDTDNDGMMDKGTVYMDSLIMPRALAIVKGGVLVVYEETLWMTRDLDGDLKADERIMLDRDYAGSDLPEHSGNGLWRGIDNWYYNAKSRLRYRFVGDSLIRDSTEFRGQWGISHDDRGRLYYNYNWSQLHADLVPPNYLRRNRNHTPVTGIDQGLTLQKRVYPVRPTPAVNRGYIPGILDAEKKLQEFTAACSPLVYRGSALPSEYYGSAFVCEPSGNLIKRNVLINVGPHLAARDPHPGREFFASTDERFRPVHLSQGPDGALYITDMYRGLIQHKAYVTPYLREQTLERNLVFPIHRGRIWRVVPAKSTRPRGIKLSKETSSALVQLLSDKDGWYRDMAQRLLVERNDREVVPALTALASKGESELGRFHALWTLEGLNALDLTLLFSLLEDKQTLIATTAIRLLENAARTDARVRERLPSTLLTKWRSAPQEQVLQIALTAGTLGRGASHDLLLDIATRYDTSALIRDAVMSSIPNEEFTFMKRLLASSSWKEKNPSREIFLETLTSAIVRKRNPSEMKSLLSMLDVDKDNFGWQQRTILTGMSIQGYGGKVAALKLNAAPLILTRRDLDIPDSQLQGLASLFEWPGSAARDTARSGGVVLTEKQKEVYALGRKLYLGSCSGCHGNDGEGLNRFAPPLRGSEWVTGDSTRLVLLVLHGIEGPLEVAGRRYAEPEILPVMPGHSTLDDGTVSAILTYIRNSWGHQAGAINRRTIGKIRITNQRVLPWTAESLQKHMDSIQDVQ